MKKKTVVTIAVFVLLMAFSLSTQAGVYFPFESNDKSFIHGDAFVRLYKSTFKYSVFIVVNGEVIGSGFVWTKDGYILTSAHVVTTEKEVVVYINEREYHEARVVGTDKEFDVALLKMLGQFDFAPVIFADSDKVRPGEWVYTIGTPFNFGFRNSITVGIVSGVRRYVTDGVQEVIQTDVALNPGNSGGPVYNLRGEVIGMAVSILPGTNNIGFVIPSNDVLLVAGEILKNGKMTYARLGINIIDLSRITGEKMARQNNLSWPLVQKEGILVIEVTENGPAEVAGVEKGDVVLSFNGGDVENSNRFRRRIALGPIGVPILMTVKRAGKKIDLWVTLVERLPSDKSDREPEKIEENRIEENPFLTRVWE